MRLSGYFVLGYYLVHIGIPRKTHKIFYLAALPCAALNILISTLQTARDGVPNGGIYDGFCLFTFLLVIAVFLFFMEGIKNHKWGKGSAAVIAELSKGTLGIYLLHIGVMELLEARGIHSAMMPVAVGVPLLALLVFALCYGISALLRRIPWVGRYLC